MRSPRSCFFKYCQEVLRSNTESRDHCSDPKSRCFTELNRASYTRRARRQRRVLAKYSELMESVRGFLEQRFSCRSCEVFVLQFCRAKDSFHAVTERVNRGASIIAHETRTVVRSVQTGQGFVTREELVVTNRTTWGAVGMSLGAWSVVGLAICSGDGSRPTLACGNGQVVAMYHSNDVCLDEVLDERLDLRTKGELYVTESRSEPGS